MRTAFTKFFMMLPLILFVFIGTSVLGQSQEQLDEIKKFEQKIEYNKDNPNFDKQRALNELEALKKAYGVKSESSESRTSGAGSDNANSSFANSSSEKATETKSNSTPAGKAHGSETSSTILISKDLFDRIPQDLQAYILSNPTKIKVAEGIKGVRQIPSEGLMISKEVFNSFSPETKAFINKHADFIKISK